MRIGGIAAHDHCDCPAERRAEYSGPSRSPFSIDLNSQGELRVRLRPRRARGSFGRSLSQTEAVGSALIRRSGLLALIPLEFKARMSRETLDSPVTREKKLKTPQMRSMVLDTTKIIVGCAHLGQHFDRRSSPHRRRPSEPGCLRYWPRAGSYFLIPRCGRLLALPPFRGAAALVSLVDFHREEKSGPVPVRFVRINPHTWYFSAHRFARRRRSRGRSLPGRRT